MLEELEILNAEILYELVTNCDTDKKWMPFTRIYYKVLETGEIITEDFRDGYEYNPKGPIRKDLDDATTNL